MRLKTFTGVLLPMLAIAVLPSCSDNDDDKNGGSSVFSGRKLLSYTEQFYYDDGSNPTYDKTMFTWRGNNIVKITELEGPERTIARDGAIATLKWSDELAPAKANLNPNGFIESWDSMELWDEVYSGGFYTYDSNGHLTSYIQSGSTGKIVYNSAGDLLSASINDQKTTLFYSSEPMQNKGGIMLMAEWGIMWDWEYFYWFGIYGKATTHLPVKSITSTVRTEKTCRYNWTFDENGYPTNCTITSYGSDYYSSYIQKYTFQWE